METRVGMPSRQNDVGRVRADPTFSLATFQLSPSQNDQPVCRTSHQRPPAAGAARSGLLGLLMIRYNAAHRGAEQEVFPVTDAMGLPVVAYTCLRWGALLRPTPDDPPGFVAPPAPAWYRFAL